MKVSIITTSFNSAGTILDTINSVAQQHYPFIEYIIIDGGSRDETLDIIKANSAHITHWISEPDKGIYDAMNKGLNLATGDIVAILNSDDFYVHAHVISQVVAHFKRTRADSIYGNIQYVGQYNTDKVVRHWVSGAYQRHNFLLGWMPPHPAFFVKRKVYQKLGYFNDQLKTSADYELMLRFLYKHRVSSDYLPELLVRMRVGGASNQSWRKRFLANWEDRRAWKMNELRPYFFTALLKPLRKVSQFLIARDLNSSPTEKRNRKHYV